MEHLWFEIDLSIFNLISFFSFIKHQTTMQQSKYGCDDTVVTQDLFIYHLAQGVKSKYPDDFKNVILQMERFHLLLK